MKICVIDDVKEVQIFLVTARSLIHLNEPCVLNVAYVNDTSCQHQTQSGFLLGVYLATSLQDPVIFVLLLYRDL